MAKEYTLIEKRLRALARSPRRRVGGDGGSSTSADGSGGSGGSTPGSDDEVAWSRKAGYAEQAGQATEAEHALRADTATEADHAASADTATEAGHAASADTATRLTGTASRTAWGRTYWKNGQPQNVTGPLTGVTDITMTGTVNLGTDWHIGSDGAGRLDELGLESGLDVGTFRTGLGGTGGTFRMIDGKSYLETDRLYVRMKGYFDSLEIRRHLHSGGNRVASAAGCKCRRVEWLDSHGEVTSQLSGVETFRCYFLATDGDDSVTNDFTVGDQAYCHTTNLANDGLTQRHYWRLVTGKGQSRDLKEHYIDLSNMEGDVSVTADGETYTHKGCSSQGDSAPAEGDDIVQLGHGWDGGRQGAIIESVSGQGQAPTYRIYQGIDSFTLPEAKIDMGYDTTTGRAYINIGDANQYLRFNYGNAAGLQIKAVIDAQSPVGGKTLATYISSLNALQTALEGYEYLKAALEGSTQVLGGLILTQLIGMKNSEGDITAGLNGDNANGLDIAAWFGGNPYAQDPVVPKIAFRFDGSGYLAGGNISWAENGDTEVKGTIKADNFFHKVCYFREGGTYVGGSARFDGKVSESAWDEEQARIGSDDPIPYEEYEGWIEALGCVEGSYYSEEEIRSATDENYGVGLPGFTPCVGAADVVMCMPTTRDWQDTTAVKLPAPGDFEGKTIEVYGFAYGVSETPPTIVIGSVVTNGMALLAFIDGDGKILFDRDYDTIEVSTGGCAKFQSVKGPGKNNYRWVLLANQTGGDVYGGGGQPMSVGLTMPVGFEVANSPVTNNGTLAVSFASGYSLPTTAKQQEWDAKQAAISDLSTIRSNASHGQTAYDWGNHAEAGYADVSWVQNNFALTSALAGYVTIGTAQTITGQKTFADLLKVNSNIEIGSGNAYKVTRNGSTIDILAYKATAGHGVGGEHWFVGNSVPGVIQSSDPLRRYTGGTAYTIWDSGNLNPSAYLRQTDISSWAKAASKPTYTLDEVADGTTRKLSDYLLANGLATAVSGNERRIVYPAGSVGWFYNADEYHFDSDLYVNSQKVATQSWVNTQLGGYLPLAGGTMEPDAIITLQETVSGRPVQSPVASRRWVNAQGFLTSADMSAYATQSWVNTRLANYQGKIHFLNSTNNGEELEFSYLTLPLSYGGAGRASLDLSAYATQAWVEQNWQIKSLSNVYDDGHQAIIMGDYIPYNVELVNGVLTVTYGHLPYQTVYWEDIEDRPDVVTALGVSGDYLTYTKNGSNMDLTVPFATRAAELRRNHITSGTLDANTMTIGSTKYAIAANYYSTDAWVNAPRGMSYGAVMELAAGSGVGVLSGQLAWDVKHNSTTPTNRLWWRARNSSGWGNDWKEIAFISDLQSYTPWFDFQEFAAHVQADYATTAALNTALTGYLPLSGGMLTGALMMGSTNHTTNDDSAKIAFNTNVNYQNISPYIQAIYENNYGRKRLSVFQKSVADWDTPQVEVFTILPNGNVGIGTTSPSEKLHVAGNIKATGNVLLPSSGSLSIEGIGAVHSNNGALTIGGISVAVESEGSFTYNGSQVATVSSLSGYLPLAGGAMTGNISFKGTKATYDMITFLDNTSDTFGNGIAIGGGGTTIIGGGESAATIAAQVSNGGSELMCIGNDSTVSVFTNLQDGWSYRKDFSFGADGRFWLPHGDNSRQMILYPNGQVQIRAATGGWAFSLSTDNNAGSTSLGQFGSYGVDDSLNYMYIGQSYSNTWMVVKPSGNVGIGTTSPTEKLDVNGSVKINGLLLGVTNIDGLLVFDQTNSQVTAGNMRVSSSFALESGCSFDMPAGSEITFDTDSAIGINGDDELYLRGNEGVRVISNLMLGQNVLQFTNGSIEASNYDGGYMHLSNDYGTFYFHGSSGSYGSLYAASFVNSSDARQKDISAYLEPSVHEIAAAPLIEFSWKGGDGSRQLGSIAQYWQTVFPEAVHVGADGMLSMEYGTIALASAVTAARKAADNERRIAELELEVAELREMVGSVATE